MQSASSELQSVVSVPASISIVINNFNYARFLRQSIDSALAQTYPRVEVLVVDDASTDGSRQIIESYGEQIIPLLRPTNEGQAAALNAGCAACKGDVVMFLDADDYLYPSAAMSVARVFRAGVSIVQYRLHLVDEGGDHIDLYPAAEIRFDTGDVRQKLVKTGRFEGTVTSGLAFARKALDAVLPIPTVTFRIAADGYLATVAPFYGDVLAIEAPLGAYRRHGGSMWLASSGGAEGFRRSIRHDADKHRELVARASECGLGVLRDPGLGDYQHVSVRLGSILLEPAAHPIIGDSRMRLGLHGATAALRASLSFRFRILLWLWFIALGTLPRVWARRLFLWRFEPTRQSHPLRQAWRMMRRRKC